MGKEIPKTVIIFYEGSEHERFFPRHFDFVAQSRYFAEVRNTLREDLRQIGGLYNNTPETWTDISKDSAEKLEKIFGVRWIPAGTQYLPGVQYSVEPVLKYASERGYGVYCHTGKELLETNGTKEDIKRIMDSFHEE